jgi:hypothetical protein
MVTPSWREPTPRVYVGEVSFTNWANRYRGQPPPPGLRSLQKLVKVP